jgi:hypothetical protein
MASCSASSPSHLQESFEFSSGGAYHISGFGEWQIALQKDGKLSIIHNLAGKITDYGSFQLPDEENRELWQLITALDLPNLESSQRPGNPDEVSYTFVLSDQSGEHLVEIWVNEALEDDRIVALVDAIASMIEATTKQIPVIK